MHSNCVGLALFLAAFFAYAGNATAEELANGTYLMGSMGDSITAGTLADGHAYPGKTSPNLTPPHPAPSPTSSFGLAIFLETYATNAWLPGMGHMENKATLSWSSGSSIQSHYMRLKQHVEEGLNGSLTVMNVAVPGEKASGMVAEAQQLVSAMQSGAFDSLKYVTFLIGANDACQGTDDNAFKAQMLEAFQTLAGIQQREPIRILVSLLPNIPSVGVPEITGMLTVGDVTCSYARDVLGKECNSLSVWSTAEEYQQRLQVVVKQNQLIEEAVAEAKVKFPQLDIALSESLFNVQITPAFLAADCFHPNQTGQQILSDQLWNDQPWFK